MTSNSDSILRPLTPKNYDSFSFNWLLICDRGGMSGQLRQMIDELFSHSQIMESYSKIEVRNACLIYGHFTWNGWVVCYQEPEIEEMKLVKEILIVVE